MICDLPMNHPNANATYPCTSQSGRLYEPSTPLSNEIIQNCSISHKLYKTGLYITSANIPQQMKDNIIQNLLVSNASQSSPQFYPQMSQFYMANVSSNSVPIGVRQQASTGSNPRVLFKKEEDEKIKKLVKIFGTRHWDLVAQFMEGRTAKQCRDRYSNYLIPGFFQGEWSKEEDQLLIQLFKENGPKWSIIQKSFKNRSSNNIKNRWYYFLHKKVDSSENDDKKIVVDQKNASNVENNLNSKSSKKNDDLLNKLEELSFDKDDLDGNDGVYQQENDFYNLFSNIDTDFDNWMIFT